MTTVNPLSGLFANSTNNSSALSRIGSRLQASIASLVSGNRLTQASDNVADFSIAIQLQEQLAGLRQSAVNFAQTSSQVQIADSAIGQQQNILDRMKQLATQSKGGAVSEEVRQAINTEFQGLKDELDRIADRTSFGGNQLLNGTFTARISDESGSESEDGGELTIPDLSTEELFEGKSLNILSQASADEALRAIEKASQKVTSARAEVGSFAQAVDYASANIISSIVNQQAASSVLTDTDFAEESSLYSLLNVQQNAAIITQAQNNKNLASVLALIS